MPMTVTIWLAGSLALSAALKARRFRAASEALGTYAIPAGLPRRLAGAVLVAAELLCAGALAGGADWATGAAAALFACFALATAAALLAGRSGRPCACFGGSARLSWSSPLVPLVGAAASTALAAGALPEPASGYERWLTLGLSVSLAAVAALAVAVLALAREIGVLRIGMADRGALEIAHEGPPLGSLQQWATERPARARAMLRLAIFTSEGCPLCRQAAPAVAHVAADPLLAVELFDEHAHEALWRRAGVPGSPFAVALTLGGVVLAKGTFNGLAQLESIVGTARFRERGGTIAA